MGHCYIEKQLEVSEKNSSSRCNFGQGDNTQNSRALRLNWMEIGPRLETSPRNYEVPSTAYWCVCVCVRASRNVPKLWHVHQQNKTVVHKLYDRDRRAKLNFVNWHLLGMYVEATIKTPKSLCLAICLFSCYWIRKLSTCTILKEKNTY